MYSITLVPNNSSATPAIRPTCRTSFLAGRQDLSVGSNHIQRLTTVMTFAMSGLLLRSGHDGQHLALRRFGMQSISEPMAITRMSSAPFHHPGRRHPRHIFLLMKSIFLKNISYIIRCFSSESQVLRTRKNFIHHDLLPIFVFGCNGLVWLSTF